MDAQDRDFLVVEADGRWFALATADVEAAVAPPPVTPLPFVPSFVEGLVSVKERILPLVDLRLLLGAAPGAHAGEVVIIETARAPCALRVDRVVGKADAAEDIEAIASTEGGTASDAVVAARFTWQARTVLLLDRDALGRAVQPRGAPAGARGLLGRLESTAAADSAADAFDALLFAIDGETFALDLCEAVEIVDLPPATPLPGAPAVAEGLARVREDVLLVLSFARLVQRAGGAVRAAGESPRADGVAPVIVVERDGTRYGLRVGRIDGVQSFPRAALRRLDDDSELAGVIADDGRLHGLVETHRLVGAALHASLLPLVPRQDARAAVAAVRTESCLHVAIGDESFALRLADVRRIARWCPPEPLRDGADGLVCGAVTLEGNVLPVVDLAGALSLDAGDTNAWVVVGDDAREWAIAVREARDILEIPANAIEELGARTRGFLSAIASVDGRLLSRLTLQPLLARNAHGSNVTEDAHAR